MRDGMGNLQVEHSLAMSKRVNFDQIPLPTQFRCQRQRSWKPENLRLTARPAAPLPKAKRNTVIRGGYQKILWRVFLGTTQ